MAESAAPDPARRYGAEYLRDPVLHLIRLRDSEPVTQVVLPDGARTWLVTRYEDVRAALADPRLSKDFRKLAGPGEVPDPMLACLYEHMLNMDPPDHTRLRRLAVKAFTPRRIAALRPRIAEMTSGVLDGLAAHAEVDLVSSFALPLPMLVICELLGVPADDRAAFRAWSEVILSSTAAPEELGEAASAMVGYLTALLAARRESPSDDLLSALIAAQDRDGSLSEREMVAMASLLLTAGRDTTANLISNGILALLLHPAELARLREDPGLLPSAVEELLRYGNPLIHATRRFALEPVRVGGAVIPAGEWVLCVTSSANRDPSRFPDPDRLDLARDSSGHVAFGHGIHFCLGAPLARLEGQVAFSALLERYPAMTLAIPASSLRWSQNNIIHRLEALPVRLRPLCQDDAGARRRSAEST